MKLTLVGLYFLVMSLFLAGYRSQALMIIPKIVGSACLIIIAFTLIRAIIRLQHVFDSNENPLAKKIHEKLGLNESKSLPELVVIRTLLYFAISLQTIVLFLRVWGMPDIYLDQLYSIMYHGITVFDITILPVRIMRAIAVFFIIMLVGRFLSTYIVQSDAFNKEKHVQLTISTLVRYASFMVSIVVALYISGISFAGVAIVIGALLVGVGFGLKHIVSHFIAGLILLNNNVVRPGDYVMIDEVEGVVKKIRLLSTEIRTAYPSTVLIPNTFLMNKSVVNYTYQGKVLHIRLQIVIENTMDTELAKELALGVAMRNTHIINNDQNKPSVLIELYESPGNVSAHLVLSAAIPSASNRELVLSELSAAILDTFKQRREKVQNLTN